MTDPSNSPAPKPANSGLPKAWTLTLPTGSSVPTTSRRSRRGHLRHRPGTDLRNHHRQTGPDTSPMGVGACPSLHNPNMTVAPRAAGAVSSEDSVTVDRVARDGRPGPRLGW